MFGNSKENIVYVQPINSLLVIFSNLLGSIEIQDVHICCAKALLTGWLILLLRPSSPVLLLVAAAANNHLLKFRRGYRCDSRVLRSNRPVTGSFKPASDTAKPVLPLRECQDAYREIILVDDLTTFRR